MSNKITREHLEAKVALLADLVDHPLTMRMGNRARGVSYFLEVNGVQLLHAGRTRPEVAHFLEGMIASARLMQSKVERKAS